MKVGAMKLKKGDRVWVKVPVNATIKSFNKRYGYTLTVDDGSEMQYFGDDEVQYIASQKIKESRPTVRAKRPAQQRKAKMPLIKGCGNCKRNEDRSCDKLVVLKGIGFCSDHHYKFWKRPVQQRKVRLELTN